jgi:hypothetical protein
MMCVCSTNPQIIDGIPITAEFLSGLHQYDENGDIIECANETDEDNEEEEAEKTSEEIQKAKTTSDELIAMRARDCTLSEPTTQDEKINAEVNQELKNKSNIFGLIKPKEYELITNLHNSK